MFDEINDIEWSPLCFTLFASVPKMENLNFLIFFLNYFLLNLILGIFLDGFERN
jgi:hypothetical protein